MSGVHRAEAHDVAPVLAREHDARVGGAQVDVLLAPDAPAEALAQALLRAREDEGEAGGEGGELGDVPREDARV